MQPKNIEFPTASMNSTHRRSMDQVLRGVEYNTQRCGKPLIPLGSAPAVALPAQDYYSTNPLTQADIGSFARVH